MGMKQSKIEGEYLPATPVSRKPISITVPTDDSFANNSDPRSPAICRTPINDYTAEDENAYCTATSFHEIPEEPVTPIYTKKTESFKKKLINGLKCSNIFDPRSPSTFINRTPIIFNDHSVHTDPADKSLNLNDTFSDLFISNAVSESIKIDATVKDDIIISNDNQLDPRSPTVGVDRTPIIFNDDDDTPDDNIMIESVLEQIKLNELQNKPQNKQLERIKNPPRRKTRSSARIAAANTVNKMSIYKDRDVKVSSTPIKSTNGNTPNTPGENNKRTPLGCVANRSQLRSKSTENKINKIRPLINSFDDYNLKNLQKDNCENNENNSSMNNFIARVN